MTTRAAVDLRYDGPIGGRCEINTDRSRAAHNQAGKS